MTDISMHSPAAITMLASKLLTQSLGSDDATPFFHFGLSNAPGPTVPLYLCGAKLQAWTVLIPLFNSLGLAFGVTSYLDKLTMSFTADRAAVPGRRRQACLDRSFAAHLKGANEMLRKHPRLLTAASPVKRRAHPGMAAMGRGAATESAPPPQIAVRRKKAAAPTPHRCRSAQW